MNEVFSVDNFTRSAMEKDIPRLTGPSAINHKRVIKTASLILRAFRAADGSRRNFCRTGGGLSSWPGVSLPRAQIFGMIEKIV